MIFSCVDLLRDTAYAGSVLAHQNKKVFGAKTKLFMVVDNLHMGKALPIRADFILTLYDKHAAILEHTPNFFAGLKI